MNHQGTVIALARDAAPGSTAVYYNVLDLKVSNLRDGQEWTGFNRLAFPAELRPAGLGIVTIDDTKGTVLDFADAPFKAISDQRYICLFQQSSKGTLLLNRFMLKRVALTKGSEPAPVLEPVWEVRFQRSGKQDIPANKRDSQSYLAPDGEPFIEPTIELPMVRNLSGGQFDVIILPNQTGSGNTWQVFEVDDLSKKLNLFAFPMDNDGLFDLSKSVIGAEGDIMPDVSVDLTLTRKDEPDTRLPYAGVPSATVYTLRERVRAENGDSLLLKRTARVLVSIPVTPDKIGGTVATLDFALSKDGTLARIQPSTKASLVSPVDNALEFGPSAYLALPNKDSSLSLKGAFAAEFWLYLDSTVSEDQFIFRGDASNAPNQAAPYVKVKNSLQIEVGFGNGTGAVAASTVSAVVAPTSWAHIKVTFDPSAASDNFTITINDSQIPVTTEGDVKTSPAGKPITTVSGTDDGIIGILDLLKIWDNSGGTENLVGDWEFATINYGQSVPTTPDRSAHKNDASVYGAILVPSSAPRETDAGGTMQVDQNGLTIYAGVLGFVQPKSSPSLLTGSDGLVHLYFQGLDDRFCVVQYDAESARSVFAAQWSSITVASNETGAVQLIAARSGTFMDRSTITISPEERAELCRIVIDNRQGRVETWKGVPRALDDFVAVLNGMSTNNLDDPQFKAGLSTFYDSDGIFFVSRLAVVDSIPSTLSVLSRFPARIQLQSAEVANVTALNCDVSLKYTVEQWPGSPVLSQTWPGISLYVKDALDTLSGISSTYAYSALQSNANVYALAAIDATGATHNALVVTRPDVTLLSFEVTDGTNPSLCTAKVKIDNGGVEHSQEFPDISRDQAPFAQAVQSGGMESYLLMLTDGLTAAVRNRTDAQPEKASMLAWATILEVFASPAVHPTAKMLKQGPVAAAILQGSSYVENDKTFALEGASTLFRASAATRPTNGGIALVQDTAALSGGVASLVVPAINGGWITESPHKALKFDGKNAVNWDQAAPSADVLAIPGDVSLETWCYPTLATSTMADTARLLTYHRVGSSALPNELIQYGLGLKPAPCVSFNDSTMVSGAYNLSGTAPECSMQIWLRPSGNSAGQILQLGTIGVVKQYVTLALDDSQFVVATYGNQLGTVRSKAKLSSNKWVQLTLTLATKDAATMTLNLYVNGVLDGATDVAQAAFGSRIGSFAAGKTSGGLPMSANGIFMWCQALSSDDVAQSYETPVPLNDPGLVIAWYLMEGTGDTVVNRAVEGSPLISRFINLPDPPWLPQGVYSLPFAINRGYGLLSRESPISAGWRHIASTYRSAFALQLPGTDYADCGNDTSLDFDSTLSIEVWCQPQNVGIVQTLVSKPGNYEIGVNYDNTVVLTIWTSDGVKRLSSNTKLTAGVPYYLAATARTAAKKVTPSKDPPKQGDPPPKPTYLLDIEIYVNGALENSFLKDDYSDPVNILTSTDRLNLGRSSAGAAYFIGRLSDVRLWNTALTGSAIATTFATHLPPHADGLVSYWRFSELQGKYAYDENNLNNGILTSNELWRLFPPASALTLLVDGEEQTDVEVVDPATLGGYGAEQLTVGASLDNTSLELPFQGQLNEVRIWNVQLTAEQISEDMYSELSGEETGLAGYWPFDAGSGIFAEDASGHDNTGRLYPKDRPPGWVTSRAPVSNEAKEVFNVLGGIQTFFQEHIGGIPSVVEYADTRRDAYGALFSIMKRCYSSDNGQGRVSLATGYKVGDLDTVYAGQVQTQPSLIGFIEGAPPIPSENQTNPWWNDVNYLNTYADTAKVRLTQAESTMRTFSGSENSGSGSSIAGKVGIYLSTGSSAEVGAAEGVGVLATQAVDWDFWNLEGHLGYAGETKTGKSAEQELGFGFGKKTTFIDELSAAGEWEPADRVLNPEVGRRYVPDNIGYALVKSMTADMYLIKLRGSNTVVKMTLVPDPDIPEDVNIIDFPIDPKYVKNGTLDGKVGFSNDPDYPDADLQRGSYFKPLEAYNLKRSIERQDKQLEAYYQQFDTSNNSAQAKLTVQDNVLTLGKNGFEKFRDELLPGDPSYDWKQRLAKRSIVNTYVWTAAGGLHTEQCELVDSYSESYRGLSSVDSSNGLDFDLAVAFVAGVYAEFDALWSTSLEILSVKSKESEASFGLEIEFAPDSYLKKPLIDDHGVPVGYGENNAPGKVDGYRFMSYFIAASDQNFLKFQSVVDQNWLNNSSDPGAAALLTATEAANGVWRVLHRVTYVSRVPPQLQPAPAETTSPPVTPPANLDSNVVILRMIENQIVDQNPTPAQIGHAITAVLGESEATPGLLAKALPWWVTFLNAAQDQRSIAYQNLYALRVDLLQYMEQTYATQAYEGVAALGSKFLTTNQQPK